MAKTGRKSKVAKISAKDVQKMASFGCTMQNIADFYNVDKSQISRSFATAYRAGIESCKLTLRKWQMKAASKGSVDMLKWLGKQMLEQKEPKQDYNVSGTLTLAQAVSDLMGNNNKDADDDK
ncbi:MAG: hypothetical protein WC356_02800 [Candidatus Micrarchaeia archaeon]|jgi:hypothetical protein